MKTSGLSSFIGGAWAIDRRYSEAFRAELAECYSLRSAEVMALARDDAPEEPTQSGTTLVVEMNGPFMKDVPGWLTFFGVSAVSSSGAAQVMRAAAADPSIENIVLHIDSPGGQVSGIEELGRAVRDLAGVKNVHAHISDLGASAAYWVAAQASTVSAGKTAEIGSIGVYAEIWDVSAAFEEEGIKVHVVSSGEDKGRMVEGTVVEPRDLAVVQDEINALAEIFIQEVAVGRGMSIEHATGLATGRTFIADDAVKFGLIDEVLSFSEALASVTAPVGASTKGEPMSEEIQDTENLVEVPAEGVDLEAVAVELEKAKAEAEAAKVALREFKQNQKASLIAEAIEAGRVTPPMVEAINKHSDLCEEPDELAVFLDCLPKQVHSVPAGASEAESGPLLTKEESDFAAKWGISDEQFAKAASVKE